MEDQFSQGQEFFRFVLEIKMSTETKEKEKIFPSFTELRIYPSFTEIREKFNAPQVNESFPRN